MPGSSLAVSDCLGLAILGFLRMQDCSTQMHDHSFRGKFELFNYFRRNANYLIFEILFSFFASLKLAPCLMISIRERIRGGPMVTVFVESSNNLIIFAENANYLILKNGFSCFELLKLGPCLMILICERIRGGPTVTVCLENSN